MKTKSLTSLLLVCLLFAMLPPLQVQSSTAPAPLPSLVQDSFGYTFNSGYGMEWYELSGDAGTPLAFINSDDGHATINLTDFEMAFYEKSYAQVEVSINGFLALEGFGNASTNINTILPEDNLPNAIVAPLWSDLLLNTSGYADGQVFYATGVDAYGKKYLVVEWYKVLRRGGGFDLPLTFEAILHENGDIVFSYLTLPGGIGKATVGIEDMDGVDGSQFTEDDPASPVIASGKSVAFHRPGPGLRVKALPRYRGAFLSNQSVDFEFTVCNTGTSADTYELEWAVTGDLDPEITFYEALEDGKLGALLPDADSDSFQETGVLQVGDRFQYIMRMITTASVDPGHFVSTDVTVKSVTDPSQEFTITRASAIPAQFAHAINNNKKEANVLFSLPENQVIEQPAPTSFTTIPSLARISHYLYMMAWQESTSIRFITMNYLSRFASTIRTYPKNPPAKQSWRDALPVIANTTENKVGLLFVRRKTTDKLKVNENIWFGLMNTNGEVIKEVNITNNTLFGNGQDTYSDYFNYPAITVTYDNKFVLAWERIRRVGDEGNNKVFIDIYMAVLDKDGNVLKAPTRLTRIGDGTCLESNPNIYPLCLDSIGDKQDYHEPVLTSVNGGGAYLMFSIYDNSEGKYKLGDMKFDGNLDLDGPPGLLPDWSGTKPDAVELTPGVVLFAWSNPVANQISYYIIRLNTGIEIIGPRSLDTPTGLAADYVSVTKDPNGNGVITWGDRQKDFLFYTFITSAGASLTEPMMFNYGYIPDTFQYFNGNMASAPLDGTKKNFIPLIGW